MQELIAFIILICSFVGVLVILARKIPVLNELPQTGSAGIRDHHFVLNLEERLKAVITFFEKQIFLHKFLSWVKTIFRRFGNGRPSVPSRAVPRDSKVFCPIMTVCPLVVSLKCFMSAGKFHRRSFFLPISLFLPTAPMIEMLMILA